jgi:hypothetical protein
MRIVANGVPAGEVLIYLTRTEAEELRDSANALLRDFDQAGYHAHVSSADYQTELTIAPEVGTSGS